MPIVDPREGGNIWGTYINVQTPGPLPLGEGWGEGHKRGLMTIYKKVYGSELDLTLYYKLKGLLHCQITPDPVEGQTDRDIFQQE